MYGIDVTQNVSRKWKRLARMQNYFGKTISCNNIMFYMKKTYNDDRRNGRSNCMFHLDQAYKRSCIIREKGTAKDNLV